MAPLDSGPLAPVSDERPAGDNLELHPDFGAMERAAQGKPEVQYGSTIEAAVPPDYREAAQLAEALLTRTHDLRVLVHLAIARLHLDSFPGFARVVTTIRQELEHNWAHVHPQLDPEDDNDPMQRSNALALLRDPARVLRTMRDLPLAGNPRIGRVAWRDIAIMNGVIEAEADKQKVTTAEVLGLFRDSDKAQIAAIREGLDTLLTELPQIIEVFDRHAGPGSSPDYDPLIKLLRDIQREVAHYQAATADAPAEDAQAADADAAPAADGAAAPVAAARAVASITGIRSLTKREEALYALDLVANYYRNHEPSSPLPLLIDRARRLAGMEFMDILRDLAPDGLSQAQLVAGSRNE